MDVRIFYAIALAITALAVWYIGQCLDWIVPIGFAMGVAVVLHRLKRDGRI